MIIIYLLLVIIEALKFNWLVFWLFVILQFCLTAINEYNKKN